MKVKIVPKKTIRLFARSIFICFENNLDPSSFHLPTKREFSSQFISRRILIYFCFMKHLISFCSHYVIYGLRILLFSPIKVRDHLLYSSNPKNKVTKNKRKLLQIWKQLLGRTLEATCRTG